MTTGKPPSQVTETGRVQSCPGCAEPIGLYGVVVYTPSGADWHEECAGKILDRWTPDVPEPSPFGLTDENGNPTRLPR